MTEKTKQEIDKAINDLWDRTPDTTPIEDMRKRAIDVLEWTLGNSDIIEVMLKEYPVVAKEPKND